MVGVALPYPIALAFGVHHPHLPPLGPGAGLPFGGPCQAPSPLSTPPYPTARAGPMVFRPWMANPRAGLLPPLPCILLTDTTSKIRSQGLGGDPEASPVMKPRPIIL